MGVCLVTGGKSHYSGLFRYNTKNVYTTTVAYAGYVPITWLTKLYYTSNSQLH